MADDEKSRVTDSQRGPRGLLPESFWEHRRAARRELLLAYRSLFDAAIERLEKKPAEQEEVARPRYRPGKLLPEAFWEHRRAARREKLLACRSLLDAVVERLEEKPRAQVARIEVE